MADFVGHVGLAGEDSLWYRYKERMLPDPRIIAVYLCVRLLELTLS
jgi:hypothetical protein